jgi:hypothetical protein
MKYNIPEPDLAKQWKDANQEDRREQAWLAFEAEYDINRPFEVQWGPDDAYFSYKDALYIYKPQYQDAISRGIELAEILKPHVLATPKILSESPHLIEFVLE